MYRFIDTDFRLPILEGMNRERIKSSLKQLDRPVCNHDLTIIGVLFYLSLPFRLRQEHWYLESSKIVRSFADNLDFCHRDATCRVRHQWSWLPDWGTVIAELEVYLKNEMQNLRSVKGPGPVQRKNRERIAPTIARYGNTMELYVRFFQH